MADDVSTTSDSHGGNAASDSGHSAYSMTGRLVRRDRRDLQTALLEALSERGATSIEGAVGMLGNHDRDGRVLRTAVRELMDAYETDDRDATLAVEAIDALTTAEYESSEPVAEFNMEFVPVGRSEDGGIICRYAPNATHPPPGPWIGRSSLQIHAPHPPLPGARHSAPLPIGSFPHTCSCVQNSIGAVCVVQSGGLFATMLARESAAALASTNTMRPPNNEQRKRCYQEIAGGRI